MKFSHLPLLLILGATPALAQELTPHESLAHFQQGFGHWTGAGTHVMAPGAEAAPWTATVSFEPILNGFAVREELHVDLGEGLPGGYHAVTLHTYDAVKQCLVAYAGDNMEGVATADAMWVDNHLVLGGGGVRNGNLTVERSTWTFGEEELSIHVLGMRDTSEPFTYVSGTFRRSETAAVDANAPRVAPQGKLQGLAPWLGKWDVSGEIVPMPGMEAVPVAGRETISCWNGGMVLQQHLVGEPNPMFGSYEMFSLLAWDEPSQRYRHLWLDSMGACGEIQGWLTDEHTFVETHAGEMMGVPYAERSVVKMGADGPQSAISDRISAEGKSERTMTIRYARAKD